MTEERLRDIEEHACIVQVRGVDKYSIRELVAEVRRYKAMAAKWKREATGLSCDVESPERYTALCAEDPELEVQP